MIEVMVYDIKCPDIFQLRWVVAVQCLLYSTTCPFLQPRLVVVLMLLAILFSSPFIGLFMKQCFGSSCVSGSQWPRFIYLLSPRTDEHMGYINLYQSIIYLLIYFFSRKHKLATLLHFLFILRKENCMLWLSTPRSMCWKLFCITRTLVFLFVASNWFSYC